MKRTSAELKRIARENLRGHYALPIGTYVVVTLIASAALAPFTFIYELNQTTTNMIIYQLAHIIISLVSIILSCGLYRIHLKLARKETPAFSDVFYCFKRRPDRFLLGGLLLVILSLVCLLPGIVCSVLAIFSSYALFFIGIPLTLAGTVGIIIVSLKYSQVFLLLTDNDSISVVEAFRQSNRMMQHNKGRLFYINLSFLGWSFLCLLSCGIGYLWLSPYMRQVSIEFYRDIKGELDAPLSNNTTSYSDDNFTYSDNTIY